MSTDVKAALRSLGWRDGSTQSVRDFQAMWNLGDALAVDGNAGPATQGALAVSLIRKASGLGDISPNFSAVEFQCNCGDGGRTVAPDCRRIWAPRSTVQMAERFRALVGPFTPERACRCPRENARVGGAKSSQHLYGRGLDLPIYTVTVAQVRKATGCDGVGTYEQNGRLYVRHIDNRGSWAQWPYPPKPFTPLKPRPDLATTPAPSEEDDDMAMTPVERQKLIEDIRDAVLDAPCIPGQSGLGGASVRANLAYARGYAGAAVDLTRGVAAKVGAPVEVDEDALAAALAPVLARGIADPSALAKAVVAEIGATLTTSKETS